MYFPFNRIRGLAKLSIKGHSLNTAEKKSLRTGTVSDMATLSVIFFIFYSLRKHL